MSMKNIGFLVGIDLSHSGLKRIEMKWFSIVGLTNLLHISQLPTWYLVLTPKKYPNVNLCNVQIAICDDIR